MTEREMQLAGQLFGGKEAAQQSMGAIQAVKEAFKEVMPGLDFDKIVGEVGAEMKRLGVQGQMELASALFGGGQSNAFVPYGPGAYPRMAEQSQQPGHLTEQPGHGVHGVEQPQQRREGMSL